MEIAIRSRYFTKDTRLLMVDLADWCGKKLLGDRIANNINLTIHVNGSAEYTKSRTYGETAIADDDDRKSPRDFLITVTNKFSTLRTLVIIAHEMVHVKQYAKRELTTCGKTNLSKWIGIPVDDEKMSYWDLPWEIEAHGREKGLVYQWAQERDHVITARWYKELF